MRRGKAAREMTAWALGAALVSSASLAHADTPKRPAAAARPPRAPADPEACARPSSAHKADPSAAAATALGDCLRKAGRIAEARAAYDEARTLARRAADVAEQRLKDLEDGQPRIMLLAPQGLPAGTAIRLDGIPIDPAATGTAFPVQPGDHFLEVTRGASRWTTRVEVEAAGITRVAIPPADGEAPAAPPPAPPIDTQVAKEDRTGSPPEPAAREAAKPADAEAPAAAPPPKAAKRSSFRWEAHRISGVVVGGAGLVALATGAAYGIEAILKKNASNDGHCKADDYCDATGRSLRADAMRMGNTSTVTLFVGGAALASGLAIFFTAPSEKPQGPEAARPQARRFTLEGVRVGVGAGSLQLVGRW